MATKGLKRGTRNKFARPFRYHGDIRMTKILTKYRLGDYVDIKVYFQQNFIHISYRLTVPVIVACHINSIMEELVKSLI